MKKSNIFIAAFAVMLAAGAAGNAEDTKADFDGSSGAAARKTMPAFSDVTVPAPSAPVAEKDADSEDNVLSYMLTLDANSRLYGSEQYVSNDGRILADKYRAAGYIVLEAQASKYPGLYMERYWVFNIKYTAPAGQIAWELDTYASVADYNLRPYFSEAPLRSEAKILEDKIKEAGYVVLENRIERYPPVTAAYGATWGCNIEFIAPAGSAPREIQYLDLWEDGQGKWYMGLPGKAKAEADGRAAAENLRAAGYIILKEYVTQGDMTNPNWRWAYNVEYIYTIK